VAWVGEDPGVGARLWGVPGPQLRLHGPHGVLEETELRQGYSWSNSSEK